MVLSVKIGIKIDLYRSCSYFHISSFCVTNNCFSDRVVGKTGAIVVKGNTYTDTTINFGKTFKQVPFIFLTFAAGSQNTKYLGARI